MRMTSALPKMPKAKNGFSIIELFVAFALIAVVAVPSFMAFRNIRLKQALAASTETMVAVLKRAHIFARESKENKSWGVKYKDDRSYVMVSGSPASWTAVGEFGLNEPVAFASGPFEIWFNQGTGGTTGEESLVMITPTNVSAEVVVSVNGVVEAR